MSKTRTWSNRWLGPALIVLAFLGLVILIAPLRNFPVEDDWDYAKEVLHLLHTGVFNRLEVTQATVFFPAVWGALFSTIFGYSFAILRVSTLVLALGALLFFYALLGELGFDLPRRTLATVALLVAPAFLYLAFSFMTDIPLFFGLIGCLYFYVRAWGHDDARLAVIGSIFAALAFLARQVGAALPLAFGMFVVLQLRDLSPKARGTKVREAVKWLVSSAAIPMLAVVLYLLWTRFGGGGPIGRIEPVP